MSNLPEKIEVKKATCPYCNSPQLLTRTSKEPFEQGTILYFHISCPVCSFIESRECFVPPQFQIDHAVNELRTERYKLVGEGGEKLYPGDFTDKEEAEVLAERYGATVVPWNCYDEGRLPIPTQVSCICGAEKYYFEVGAIEVDKESILYVCHQCPRRII